MPSIVIQSSAFQSVGIVLADQQVEEEASGLVSVAVRYVTTPSKRDAVAKLFYPGARPPIFPSAVNKEELQARNLFLVDRSIKQSNGLVEIDAKYAGALSRALTQPTITFGREIVNVRLKVRDGMYYHENTKDQDAQPGQSNAYSETLYAYYSIRASVGVKTYSSCIVGDNEYNIPTPELSELILGAQYTSLPNLHVVTTPDQSRDMTPIQLLTAYSNAQINSDASYNFITPNVKVEQRRFFVTLNSNF